MLAFLLCFVNIYINVLVYLYYIRLKIKLQALTWSFIQNGIVLVSHYKVV